MRKRGFFKKSLSFFQELQLGWLAGGTAEVVEKDVLRVGRRKDGRFYFRLQTVDLLQGGAEGPHEFGRTEIAVVQDIASMQRSRRGDRGGFRDERESRYFALHGVRHDDFHD